MFGSTVVEVAIGLVFMYLLLSLLCSAAKEGIEAIMKMRAIALEQGIKELLGDPKGVGIAKKFYEHPLIDGLFPGTYQEQKGGRLWSNLPSYITAASFSQALIEVIQDGTAKPDPPADPAQASAVALKRLRDAVVALPANNRVKGALVALIDTAEGDMNKARANIEAWFNSSMDHVSGWYKRWSQWVIFGLGFLLVALLNADTITVGNNLASDPALRQTLTTVAEEYVKKHPEEAGSDAMKQNAMALQKVGLPIGWDRDDVRRWPQSGWEWVLKVVGLVMTSLAISLGAPFWFDVLNKFMVVRSTVKPAEKSPVEKSKD